MHVIRLSSPRTNSPDLHFATTEIPPHARGAYLSREAAVSKKSLNRSLMVAALELGRSIIAGTDKTGQAKPRAAEVTGAVLTHVNNAASLDTTSKYNEASSLAQTGWNLSKIARAGENHMTELYSDDEHTPALIRRMPVRYSVAKRHVTSQRDEYLR